MGTMIGFVVMRIVLVCVAFYYRAMQVQGAAVCGSCYMIPVWHVIKLLHISSVTSSQAVTPTAFPAACIANDTTFRGGCWTLRASAHLLGVEGQACPTPSDCRTVCPPMDKTLPRTSPVAQL